MKKLIMLLAAAFICCVSMSAQTYRYRSSDYAFGERNSQGTVIWGDWEDCNVVITIDLEREFIKVYSERAQNYVIVSAGDTYEDGAGTSLDMDAVDEEGIECTIRLRVQDDGTTQMYAYYSDVAWVYSGLEWL